MSNPPPDSIAVPPLAYAGVGTINIGRVRRLGLIFALAYGALRLATMAMWLWFVASAGRGASINLTISRWLGRQWLVLDYAALLAFGLGGGLLCLTAFAWIRGRPMRWAMWTAVVPMILVVSVTTWAAWEHVNLPISGIDVLAQALRGISQLALLTLILAAVVSDQSGPGLERWSAANRPLAGTAILIAGCIAIAALNGWIAVMGLAIDRDGKYPFEIYGGNYLLIGRILFAISTILSAVLFMYKPRLGKALAISVLLLAAAAVTRDIIGIVESYRFLIEIGGTQEMIQQFVGLVLDTVVRSAGFLLLAALIAWPAARVPH